jgi:hypothetical protein
MPVYRLIPVDPSDPVWQASSHRGGVLVRAGSEGRARELALLAFANAVGRDAEGDQRALPSPPWRDAGKVHVEVAIATHPADGPEGVLEPPGHG